MLSSLGVRPQVYSAISQRHWSRSVDNRWFQTAPTKLKARAAAGASGSSEWLNFSLYYFVHGGIIAKRFRFLRIPLYCRQACIIPPT
jgi:hypothetical protein